MMRCTRRAARIVTVSCTVLAISALARAQSAADGFNPGASGLVNAVVVQPDGKILVGGNFTELGGGSGTTVRRYIGRLHADGSVDASFNPGANSTVFDLALQADGKILIAGAFTALGGGFGSTPRRYIGRLNADGSIDTGFDPGAENFVTALAVQPDGKIVVGGYFALLGGGTGTTTPRSRIGRLHADGSVDADFDPGANEFVLAVAMQPDGNILVGGGFTMMGGGGTGATPRGRIARLNADGSVDTSFNPVHQRRC